MRVGGLLRYRYLLLAVIAAGAAAWLIWYLQRVYQPDYLISVFGGYSFFGWLPTYHHSGLHLYATNPEIQMGPTRARIPVWTAWTLVAEFAVQEWAPTGVGAWFHLVFAVSVLGVLLIPQGVHASSDWLADPPELSPAAA